MGRGSGPLRHCGGHWVTTCALQTPANLEIHWSLQETSSPEAAAESWGSPGCRAQWPGLGSGLCRGKAAEWGWCGGHSTRSPSRGAKLAAALLKAPGSSRAAGEAALTQSSTGLTHLQGYPRGCGWDIPEDVAGSGSSASSQHSSALSCAPVPGWQSKSSPWFILVYLVTFGLLASALALSPGHGGHWQPPFPLPGWQLSLSWCHLGIPFSQMSSAGQDSELNTPAWQGTLPRLPGQYGIKSHTETKRLLPPQINHQKEENASHFKKFRLSLTSDMLPLTWDLIRDFHLLLVLSYNEPFNSVNKKI